MLTRRERAEHPASSRAVCTLGASSSAELQRSAGGEGGGANLVVVSLIPGELMQLGPSHLDEFQNVNPTFRVVQTALCPAAKAANIKTTKCRLKTKFREFYISELYSLFIRAGHPFALCGVDPFDHSKQS